MSDTPKTGPGSNPGKGGQDQRRGKGQPAGRTAVTPATTPPAGPPPAATTPATTPASAPPSAPPPAAAPAAMQPPSSPASGTGSASAGSPSAAAPATGATAAAGSATPSPTTPAPAPSGQALPKPGPLPAASTTASTSATPPRRADRDRWILPAAAIGGVVVLGLAWAIVANRPAPGVDPARVEALEQQLNGLTPQLAPLADRIGRLEQQGAALERADQRLAALEAALKEREPVSLEALNTLRGRLDRQEGALAEQQRRTTAEIEEAERGLSQRITGAEAQLAQRVAAAEAALGPKLAALETTLQQRLAAAEQAARQQADAQQQRINDRFATLEQREARIVAAEQRLNRLVASTALATALEAGKPLSAGLAALPGTPPPALAKYAAAAPPTMASLRLSFEEAARAARAAAEPATEGQGVLEAAATRLSNLVTIRRGDSVVWGDAVSGALEGARQALNAGDLEAAVQKVAALPAPARAPMEGWLTQARDLQAARAALEELMAAPRGQG